MLDNVFQAKFHVRMDTKEGAAAIEFYGQSSADFDITLIVDGDGTRMYNLKGNDYTNLLNVHNPQIRKGVYLVDDEGFNRGIRVNSRDIVILLARVDGEVVGSAMYEIRCDKYLHDRYAVLLPIHVNNMLIEMEHGFPIKLPAEHNI